MKVKDIIFKVKARMQELTPFGEGLGILDPSTGNPIPVTEGLVVLRPDSYEKPIESYIKECLEEAYDLLIDIAPQLADTKSGNPTPSKNQNGSGKVILPDDFYKLIYYKMKGWEKPVTIAIEINDPAYQLQFNDYTRGGISRPVCAIINEEDKKVLEYYSLPKSFREHALEKFLYIPKLSVEKDSNGMIKNESEIVLNSDFVIPFIYMVASRVYLIYEQQDMSKAMQEKAIESINKTK